MRYKQKSRYVTQKIYYEYRWYCIWNERRQDLMSLISENRKEAVTLIAYVVWQPCVLWTENLLLKCKEQIFNNRSKNSLTSIGDGMNCTFEHIWLKFRAYLLKFIKNFRDKMKLDERYECGYNRFRNKKIGIFNRIWPALISLRRNMLSWKSEMIFIM